MRGLINQSINEILQILILQTHIFGVFKEPFFGRLGVGNCLLGGEGL